MVCCYPILSVDVHQSPKDSLYIFIVSHSDHNFIFLNRLLNQNKKDHSHIGHSYKLLTLTPHRIFRVEFKGGKKSERKKE